MIALLILLNVYFVSFTDKPEKSAPALSERAIEQRAKWGIETDEKDYPVCTLYLNEVRKAGGSIYHTSRWFNGATVEMDTATAATVAKMSFVTSVEMTRDNTAPRYAPRHRRVAARIKAEETPVYTDAQLALYNLQSLHNAGFEGQGILMAFCDGGFYNANEQMGFRPEELELGHFDFTDDDKYGYDFYGAEGLHGTMCLSTVTGLLQNFKGAATQSQYYLMRSEENDTESPKEMDNLVAAMEKADSLGVNIFSVSLGYAYFDNAAWDVPKSAFDGKTVRCSRAADIAARKGMLVCIAAGNEGDEGGNPPHTLGIPGDADSILTVGAVGTDSVVGYFSSYGPTSDGRIKPEVCAVGVQAISIHPNLGIVSGNGTSYATPLLAGFAAALWSALPDENAMQIRERIIRSSDRYANPDTHNYKYGYGIPDAWKAYKMELPQGMESVQHSEVSVQKVLRDGQLLIMRGEQVYNIAGQRVQ